MPLTPEQHRALEALTGAPAAHDWTSLWLGVPLAELRARWSLARAQLRAAEQAALTWAARNPLEAAFQFIAGAAAAFYQAEKGANPKIRTYLDAFYYISTCASVGYADIFAVTQTGRAIAAVVMLVGPALAARTLDPGAGPQHRFEPPPTQGERS